MGDTDNESFLINLGANSILVRIFNRLCELTDIIGGGGSSATKRTPTCTAAVASGNTTDGVKSVTFLASSDFSGTVLGSPLAAGASITFRAPNADTIGAMAFTRAAGTLYIYYIP